MSLKTYAAFTLWFAEASTQPVGWLVRSLRLDRLEMAIRIPEFLPGSENGQTGDHFPTSISVQACHSTWLLNGFFSVAVTADR